MASITYMLLYVVAHALRQHGDRLHACLSTCVCMVTLGTWLVVVHCSVCVGGTSQVHLCQELPDCQAKPTLSDTVRCGRRLWRPSVACMGLEKKWIHLCFRQQQHRTASSAAGSACAIAPCQANKQLSAAPLMGATVDTLHISRSILHRLRHLFGRPGRAVLLSRSST